ncbi:SHOCT domain-containing protein [Candidatus Saccharibacteria bacterium]|nr:SHOCT domain-containing protein [Candidatus Saccharibacteria bacterium]
MMYDYNDNFGGGLFMILILILLVVGAFVAYRYYSNTPRTGEKSSPLDILKERYAKGEIDKKEFEDKRKDLEG